MDISNIYDLPDEKLQQYSAEPFPDDEIRPGLKNFAKKFKAEIVNLPTPYVMALEGGYGTGKTYFITRFCEYLKNSNFKGDEQINAIYLNLWENDYVSDPFPVIAAKMLDALEPGHALQKEIKDNAIKITKNLLKFGSRIFGGVDIGDLLPDLSQDKKDIKAFKESIRKAISEKGAKVVLVVDELDRCKPDYAVKALETIKHFFDIDGLLVILTTKLDFMDNICEAYYGHPRCDIHMGEGYIQKFVQYKKILNPTSVSDYLFIINSMFNTISLPVRSSNFHGVLERESPENKQAIIKFDNNMADIFYSSKLSIRKTLDVCKELLKIINTYNDIIWKDRVSNYPEFILVKYMQKKQIIPENILEPKVLYEYQPSLAEIQQDLDDKLRQLF